jgi:hypothetical protein
MGNEQGHAVTEAARQPGAAPIVYEYESVIVIRGSRKSGKSTLVSRMKGGSFHPAYTPTTDPYSFEIPWKTDAGRFVKLRIIDIAEGYLAGRSRRQRDASIVATVNGADGLVILIDSRDADSVHMAASILSEAGDAHQVVIFSNFLDDSDVTPAIPEELHDYVGRFYFIPGSLKTNQGLVEFAAWMQLPMVAAKRRTYEEKLRGVDETIKRVSTEFTRTARNFEREDIARSHMPQLRPKPSAASSAPGAAPTEGEELFPVTGGSTTVPKKRQRFRRGKRATEEEDAPVRRRPGPVAKKEAKPAIVRRQQQASDGARFEVLPRDDYDAM